MSDEFQPDNWPEEYFENPPLEQIIGHGNDRGTIDVYRCEDGLVWHTTHEKCDYHGPTGPRTKANFRLTDVQEFAIAKDLASHFPSTQRRALLDHLLDTEGLPGVWEIDAKYLLRKMEKVGIENVYLSQRNQELWAENERLRQEVEDAELAASGMSDDLSDLGRKFDDFVDAVFDWWRDSERYPQDMEDLLKVETFVRPDEVEYLRRSRLHELLEAEAREPNVRVQLNVLDNGAFEVFAHTGDQWGSSHMSQQFQPGDSADFIESDIWGQIISLWAMRNAALAEKRQRELAHEITQPVDPVSMAGESEVSE